MSFPDGLEELHEFNNSSGGSAIFLANKTRLNCFPNSLLASLLVCQLRDKAEEFPLGINASFVRLIILL